MFLLEVDLLMIVFRICIFQVRGMDPSDVRPQVFMIAALDGILQSQSADQFDMFYKFFLNQLITSLPREVWLLFAFYKEPGDNYTL